MRSTGRWKIAGSSRGLRGVRGGGGIRCTISRSARGRPGESRDERVPAAQRHAAGDVVEPPADPAGGLAREGLDDPQADHVYPHGEGAVAGGPGRLGPLKRRIELEPRAAQGEPDPAPRTLGDEVERLTAARGVP